MKEINLDEILAKHLSGYEDYSSGMKSDIKESTIDFGKQLLAAAADNAKIKSVIKPNHFGVIEEIDKNSISLKPNNPC